MRISPAGQVALAALLHHFLLLLAQLAPRRCLAPIAILQEPFRAPANLRARGPSASLDEAEAVAMIQPLLDEVLLLILACHLALEEDGIAVDLAHPVGVNLVLNVRRCEQAIDLVRMRHCRRFLHHPLFDVKALQRLGELASEKSAILFLLVAQLPPEHIREVKAVLELKVLLCPESRGGRGGFHIGRVLLPLYIIHFFPQ
mmetsp:Transcript_26576/g.60631  ORF Transcript_26576/g.60631 Transcript_26576/m.60631 type:complete len:201 (-) Transcript_26576:414-1016(-)